MLLYSPNDVAFSTLVPVLQFRDKFYGKKNSNGQLSPYSTENSKKQINKIHATVKLFLIHCGGGLVSNGALRKEEECLPRSL